MRVGGLLPHLHEHLHPPVRLLLLLLLTTGSVSAMVETDRVAEYRRRYGDQWPPAEWPTSDGWKEWVGAEEARLGMMEDRDACWFEWMNLVQSMSVRKFSDLGFELLDVPERIYRKLKDAALNTPLESIPFEREVDADGIVPRPRFLDTEAINNEILAELQEMHEEWSGVPLELSKAYGLRFYLNQSTLVWHLDKVETHVVSGILHIGSEPDQDTSPWPLEIIGHDGKVHKIVFKPGQLLFYESSKLSHGRPSTFNGTWYTSVFLHYRPRSWEVRRDDMSVSVPPHWWPSKQAAAKTGGGMIHDEL